MEGLQEVTNTLSIFWVNTIFLLLVSPLRPPNQGSIKLTNLLT